MGISSSFMSYNPNLSIKLIVVNMPLIKLSCHHYVIQFIIEKYTLAAFLRLTQTFMSLFCANINGISNQ